MFGKNLRRNKKGSLIDIIFIGVALLFFSIVVLVGLKIATDFGDKIDTMDIFDDGESRQHVDAVTVKYTNTVDNMFLFLLIFMAIASLVLAALVRIHPIFIPFYFIGWVFVIYLSGILSNIYQSMAANTNLIAIANQMTVMHNIMIALPIIVGVFGMVLLVCMYKLWSVAQQ